METKAAKNDIPIKIMMENIDIISYNLYHNFNISLLQYVFPSKLKEAGIKRRCTDHKKKKKYLKHNYQPVSILQMSVRYAID